jgi:RNA polymerase sigma-70 factor (ECF subfamily)
MGATNPERWVDDHGDVLYRYALARVRDATVAEDLLQETFVAALKAQEGFAGQSSERTWLTGILKHKLIDHFRKRSREVPFDPTEPLPAAFEMQFDAAGHWNVAAGFGPKDWGSDAAGDMENKEFWEILDNCLGKLPPRTAQAFTLREMDDLPGEEICKVLQITATNLWVLLHRARMQLRQCLEMNWFSK